MADSLTLGSLVIHDGTGNHGGPFSLEVLAESASFGEPQPAEVVFNSLIRDGALTRWDHDDNREMSFLVRVTGADDKALAEGVAALRAQTNKPTTLMWTSFDGIAAPTVFEVQTSSLHEFNGFDDLAALRHQVTLQLRLIAFPYPRSLNKVSDDAVATDWASGTVYDSGSSTTGWSGWLVYRTPVVVVDSGMVKIEYSSKLIRSAIYDGEAVAEWRNKDTRSGLSIATGSGGYLSVVVKLDRIFEYDIALTGGGGTRSRLDQITMTTSTGATITPTFSAVSQLADGNVRYAWAVDAGLTITAITFDSYQYAWAQGTPSDPYVRYDDLRLSSTTTTDNQYAKVVEVPGSVRAPGALHVSATTALGCVFLCTVPDDQIATGFTADVTRWKTSGTTRTADAAVINGGYFPGSSGAYVFEVPVGLLTEGAYSVVMLVKNNAPNTATVSAQVVIGGNLVGAAQTIAASEPSDVGGGTAYRFLTVGELYLPTTPVQNPDSTTKVRITVANPTPAFAEIWLAPTWGDLTLVNCGTGTVSASGASSHFWVDSPSPERPMGGWWRGAADDRALAVSAVSSLVQPGRHLLYPPRTRVFVASSASVGPVVESELYARWWGMAAQ